MKEWLAANIGNIVIGVLVAGALAFAVCAIVKRRKKGGCSCVCGCSGCAMAGKCHSAAEKK